MSILRFITHKMLLSTGSSLITRLFWETLNFSKEANSGYCRDVNTLLAYEVPWPEGFTLIIFVIMSRL